MVDYTSKVPFYSFPTDSLAAQEEALAQNPLMQRLLASRQAYAGVKGRAPQSQEAACSQGIGLPSSLRSV